MASVPLKLKRALHGVFRNLRPLTFLAFLLVSPFCSARRSQLFTSLDVSANVSAELSAFLADELAIEDPDSVISLPLFRDLSLLTRSFRFVVNGQCHIRTDRFFHRYLWYEPLR